MSVHFRTHAAIFVVLIAAMSGWLANNVEAKVSAKNTKTTQGWNIRARPFDADFAGGAQNLVWSSDGRFLAAQGAEGISVRDVHSMKMRHFLSRAMLGWTAESSAPLSNLRFDKMPRLVAFVGNRLVFSYSTYNERTNSWQPWIEWRNLRDGQRVDLWKNANLSRDEQSIYFVAQKNRFRIYHFAPQRWFDALLPLRVDAASPEMTNPYDGSLTQLNAPSIDFWPDGLRAADSTSDGRIRLWNVKTRRIVATLEDKRGEYKELPGATGPVAWSPNGKLVATQGEDPTHRNIFFEEGPNDGSINEHPPVVKVWDAHSGKLVNWWNSSQDRTQGVTFLRCLDNARLAVGAPGVFQIWNAAKGKRLSATPIKDSFDLLPVQSLSPDGKTLAAVARIRNARAPADFISTTVSIRVLERGLMTPARIVKPGAEAIDGVAWSHDGRYIATTIKTGEGGVRFWQWQKRTKMFSAGFAVHSPIHFGWTKKHRFWTSDFYQITLWNAQRNWRQSAIKPLHDAQLNPPATGFLMTSDENTVLQIADMFANPRNAVWRSDKRQKPYLWLQAPDSGGFVESISPDGRYYCVPSTLNDQPMLTLYDLEKKNQKLVLTPSIRNPKSGDEANYAWESGATFSRDGKTLAFGGRIFSMPQGRVLSERHAPLDGNAVALSSNGRLIVRQSGLKNAGLWLFAATNGKRLRLISRDLGGIKAVDFAPDDKTLVVARYGDLEFYNVATGILTSKATVLNPPHPKQTKPEWHIWPITTTNR